MSLEHIEPHDIIQKTADRYKHMQMIPGSVYTSAHLLSRQVQALAEVLTEEINNKLLEIENAFE